jgi:hypothetical protein
VSDPFVSMTVGNTGETVRITDSHGNQWEPVPKKVQSPFELVLFGFVFGLVVGVIIGYGLR